MVGGQIAVVGRVGVGGGAGLRWQPWPCLVAALRFFLDSSEGWQALPLGSRVQPSANHTISPSGPAGAGWLVRWGLGWLAE